MRNSTRGLISCTFLLALLASAACGSDSSLNETAGDPAASPGSGRPGGGGSPPAVVPGYPPPGTSAPGPTPSPSPPATPPVLTPPPAAPSGSGAAAPVAPVPPPAVLPPPSGGGQRPQSGLLTAGSWDDNLNYDFFRRYTQSLSGRQLPGLPEAPISDRLVVQVTDGAGAPVAGARVSATSGQTEVAHTQTGADGRALFFPNWAGIGAGASLDIVAQAGGRTGTVTAKAGDAVLTVPVGVARGVVTGLDVAILIDTTGSMGDEISYLQAELLNISASVTDRYPNVSQRWAFVAYKDYRDEYVTRPFDFVEDLQAFKGSFGRLGAAGGGDYEEAPEKGLEDLNTLTWRDGAVARVAFWVGDAPHHNQYAPNLLEGIRSLKSRGVHIYPVSASGTSELLEYSMRLAAMVTGGRYLFLTDDSGIGGAHKEPTVPCYLVTTLQRAMLRMITMEITGTRVDPAPMEVLRTGGNPRDGRCRLGSGEEVQVF